MTKLIIVTGGTGYIGSHICAKALEIGMLVGSLDVKRRPNVQKSLYSIQPDNFLHNYRFIQVDIRELNSLEDALENIYGYFDGRYSSVTIIHCAAYKSVGESVDNPLKYYDNNICSTLNLLKVLKNISCFIMSSSACVYGYNKDRQKPYLYSVDDEDVGRYISNPYGRTKYFQEEIIKDVSKVNPDIKFVILRYFNPIYSHPLLPEDRSSPNLYPQIMNSIETGKPLKIFGNDYNTRDGTCIRDYVSVLDVAEKHLIDIESSGNLIIKNIGTQKGMTVLELIDDIEKSMGVEVKKDFVERRPGDVPEILSIID